MPYYAAKSSAAGNVVTPPGSNVYPYQVIYDLVVGELRSNFNEPFNHNASQGVSGLNTGTTPLALVTLASCGVDTNSRLLRLLISIAHRLGSPRFNFPDVDQINADDLNGGSIGTTPLPTQLIYINDLVAYIQEYF